MIDASRYDQRSVFYKFISLVLHSLSTLDEMNIIRDIQSILHTCISLLKQVHLTLFRRKCPFLDNIIIRSF